MAPRRGPNPRLWYIIGNAGYLDILLRFRLFIFMINTSNTFMYRFPLIRYMVNAIDNRTSSKSTYPFFQSRQRYSIGFFHLCKRRQVRITGFRIHQESGSLDIFPLMGAFLRKRSHLLTPGGLIIVSRNLE
ncbi:hypothetical protein AVEN_36994-1 [Araneus ventricosus]|uniref:Uncharacterized protein n=1 Tax=Araneus ventricosus TaxID=182803 RepID=A0A4Y2U1G9_ARAVE|nr:hypothetical protein AVEN_36994-1 [Araneus ventricosus]